MLFALVIATGAYPAISPGADSPAAAIHREAGAVAATAAPDKAPKADPPTATSDAQAPAYTPLGAPKRVPFTLIGVGPRDLLSESPLATNDAGDLPPFEFPETASTTPVAIPFPTAVHLFVPGAIMAIYATRRFKRRRR
ncbi:hypothetical protein [Humisphaera borealis]|uniref:Uncharacterized protein n=1 Tax=Humisphaera borealis TaxID=2807512 RepID=A0A7M2X1X9_9BACT|nr:hypothetical protein [Humisphaera borealis]QOV91599.1 hypothetical protein IPV69_09650 [Humisphaera borealis]